MGAVRIRVAGAVGAHRLLRVERGLEAAEVERPCAAAQVTLALAPLIGDGQFGGAQEAQRLHDQSSWSSPLGGGVNIDPGGRQRDSPDHVHPALLAGLDPALRCLLGGQREKWRSERGDLETVPVWEGIHEDGTGVIGMLDHQGAALIDARGETPDGTGGGRLCGPGRSRCASPFRPGDEILPGTAINV